MEGVVRVSGYEKTHLGGSIYSSDRCEHLLYATEKGQTHGKKALQQYFVYCTAEHRCRSMGCAASWTGCSPKWCPKRKALESKEEATQ